MRSCKPDSAEVTEYLASRDAEVCRDARNALVEAFPDMSRAAYRMLSFALDEQFRAGGLRVNDYAKLVKSRPQTLTSRFFRGATALGISTRGYGIKSIFARCALVRMAAALEHSAVSATAAALYLGYASPQGMGRTAQMLVKRPLSERRQGWRARDEVAALIAFLTPARPILANLTDTPRASVPVVLSKCEKCERCGGQGYEVRARRTQAEVRTQSFYDRVALKKVAEVRRGEA